MTKRQRRARQRAMRRHPAAVRELRALAGVIEVPTPPSLFRRLVRLIGA